MNTMNTYPKKRGQVLVAASPSRDQDLALFVCLKLNQSRLASLINY